MEKVKKLVDTVKRFVARKIKSPQKFKIGQKVESCCVSAVTLRTDFFVVNFPFEN